MVQELGLFHLSHFEPSLCLSASVQESEEAISEYPLHSAVGLFASWTRGRNCSLLPSVY